MRQIRVFVSSPSDCVHERQALEEAVQRINASESERTGLFLRLFAWENDVVPRIGPPPQAVIDEQTPLCDIYVGIMSGRFGGDGTRESGTEHEFRQALERAARTEQPWILFYFNDDPPRPRTAAESRQQTRVFEFREEIESRGIVGRYSGARGSANGFFEQVDLHLRRLLQRPELNVTAARLEARTAAATVARSSSERPVIPAEYLGWLRQRCATVDLLGLEPKHGSAAKLHSIYVPLTTSRGTAQHEEAERLRRRRRALRDLESLEREGEGQTLVLDRLGNESLYVSGGPGSGKSTFCRWVAWLVTEGRLPTFSPRPPYGFRESWPKAFDGRLPVLIRLRDAWRALPTRGAAQDLSRVDFEAALAQWIEVNTEGLAGETFRRHLAYGSALLILDGVDEVPVSVAEGPSRWSPRGALVSGLANACSVWDKAGNRILITSRPYGLSAAEADALGIPSALLQHLDRPLQDFLLKRWFQQLRPIDEAATYANNLLAHIDGHRWLRPLAANPLLLTGMCIIFDEGGRLPQDKHDLYARIVNTVLYSRYRDNVEDREKARYRLQAVAFGMHTGHALGESRRSPLTEASVSEIDRILSAYLERSPAKEDGAVAVISAREELLSQSGLFLSRGDGRAGFFHFSFQEFLAGLRLADLEEDLATVFIARASTPEWHNTLSLLFAGQSRERAVRLVTRITSSLPQEFESNPGGLQSVVADCLDILHARGVRVDPATETLCRDAFLKTLLADERNSSVEADIRCRTGSTLGRIGDPRFHDHRLFCLPNDEGFGFVEIPAGEFVMGSTRHDIGSLEIELPQHHLALPSFLIARYPVTLAQFTAFHNASGYTPGDSQWAGGVPNHPVTYVTWHDAMAYCQWLTESIRKIADASSAPAFAALAAEYRVTLPSEAEWERVARGTSGRTYPWGEDANRVAANFGSWGVGTTSPVGAFPRSGTPKLEGHVQELSGNVWEWTRSRFEPYPYKPDDGRERDEAAEDSSFTVRGGSFNDDRHMVRASSRLRCRSYVTGGNLGFRVVISRAA